MGFFKIEPSDPTYTINRVALLAQVQALDAKGLHNFCIGPLEAYFRIGYLPEENVQLINRVLCLSGLPGSLSRKVFVYAGGEGDLQRLAQLQTQSVIYSQVPIKLRKQSVFEETQYELEKVFEPSSYINSRKRNRSRIKAWQSHISLAYDRSRPSLQSARPADMPDIDDLHEKWVARKMADPLTQRNMFPKVRYMNCVRLALASPARYRVYLAWLDGQVIACRVVYIERDAAYCLAFFCRFWDCPSGFVEDISVATMADLLASGCRTLNCGASLHKHLATFKQHWPWMSMRSYAYGRIKPA